MASTTGRRGRRISAGLLGLALGLGATAVMAPGPPAGAAPTDSDTLVFVSTDEGAPASAFTRNGETVYATDVPVLDAVVEGDFSAAPGTDLFVYSAGGWRDGIIHVAPTGTGVTPSFRPEVVSGRYTPVAGDFDGNGIDDILWYSPSTPDSIWLFRADGGHDTVRFDVTGSYVPVVLDTDGDGYDDVVWYGSGTAPDSIWLFGEDATHTTRPVRIDGRYEPLVGRFGGVPDHGEQEQVIWYAPQGPDVVWTFTATGKTSRSLPNEDGAQAVVGDIAGNDRDAVYWYRPGAATDTTTGFGSDGAPIQVAVPQVRGTYDPVAGDYDGDGRDDIAWTRAGTAVVWHSAPTILTYTESYVSTHTIRAVAARTRASDLDD